MRRRRRRGGANCARALNARKALNPESTGLASGTLKSDRQLCPLEGTCSHWHFGSQDQVKVMRRRRTWKTRRGIKPDNEAQTALLPSKEKSHLRNTRFSKLENMTLISKLVPVYDQLLGRSQSRTPVLMRNQMWQEICDAVNSVGKKLRNVYHCKKRFNDLRRQLKNKLNQEKRFLGDHDGASAFKIHYTQYEEELKRVLPAEVIDGIEFFDSDHPHDLYPGEEAGPSWYTPQNGQNLLSRELQNISKPAKLQGPLNLGLLDEQWSVLLDLSSTFPMDSSTVRSRNFSTDHIDLHHNSPRKTRLHPSCASIEEPSPPNVPNVTDNHGACLLKVLKSTQRRFQKGMMHSLNVLCSDVGHFNKCIDESSSTADNLLRVEGERNHILHQMNNQLGKLAESVDQLAKRQQAEQILLRDFSRRQNSRSQSLYPSRRGKRTGGNRQARGVCRSLRRTSSAMTCLTEPGFMLGVHHNRVIE